MGEEGWEFEGEVEDSIVELNEDGREREARNAKSSSSCFDEEGGLEVNV